MIVPHRRLLGVCRDSASCIQPEDAAVNGFGSGLNGWSWQEAGDSFTVLRVSASQARTATGGSHGVPLIVWGGKMRRHCRLRVPKRIPELETLIRSIRSQQSVDSRVPRPMPSCPPGVSA